MARIAPARRPHYPPSERLAILTLRAAAGWSAAETARRFLVAAATIASWTERLDEQGTEALVRLAAPVNRFPDFVTALVQRLRATIPSFGRRKLAAVLARAGLCLSATTVRRLSNKALAPVSPPDAPRAAGVTEHAEVSDIASEAKSARVVSAREPHRLWHVDLTLVPTVGLWLPWLPFSLPIHWPFVWHVAVVLDHASRAVVAHAVFPKAPTGRQLCALLDRARRAVDRTPRYVVSDQGSQFRSAYRRWCARHDVRARFGAIGQKGSIAILERFFRSLKGECFRKIVVPFARKAMIAELSAYIRWYNDCRPHDALRGRTPTERLAGSKGASDTPRLEPRARYPLGDAASAARTAPAARRTGRLEATWKAKHTCRWSRSAKRPEPRAIDSSFRSSAPRGGIVFGHPAR